MAELAPACEDIHPLFVEQDVFLVTAKDLSSCIASFEITGNLETSTSSVGSGFVVALFSLVSVLLGSRLHGPWVDVTEKSPKNS